MRLKSVRVCNYKSIWDTGEFEIGGTTCLVGKNESGKTAILEAIHAVRPYQVTRKYDPVEHYPRAEVGDYQQDVADKKLAPANVATLVFEIDGATLERIHQAFGPDSVPANDVGLVKGYDNVTRFRLKSDERAALKYALRDVELPTIAAKEINAQVSFEDAVGVLADVEQTSDVKRLLERLRPVAEAGFDRYVYNQFIGPGLPYFLYFDEYYQMRGAENAIALMKRRDEGEQRESDLPLLGLLEIAGLKLEDLVNASKTQDVINRLESAGNTLSARALKYWSQNKHIRTKFDARMGLPGDPEELQNGLNVFAQIYDTRHMVTTGLGTRSRGFVWFFSFLAWYHTVKRKQENVVLLLDEPGLSLHGRAQADLLRFFREELEHQLIYTTHSPFMVDATQFEQVRIVQDLGIDADETLPRAVDGTKVTTDVLEATQDSLFPLQGALGYDISQTLFVGPYCLVVEGVSDLLFLQTMSSILSSRKREALDARWTITPVGGADKVPTFVALLGAQSELTLATLIDFQLKDKQTVENLYKKKLLAKSNVLTYADFAGAKEADVEDMFDAGFYLRLVNAEYQLSPSIKVAALNNKIPRLVLRLERYFAKKPLDGGASLNHYRPARHFAENAAKYEKHLSDKTLDRFEAAFATLNQLLG